MEAFHRHLLAGHGKSSALRAAQGELARGDAGAAATYPYAWAGFQLYGDSD
jgi:CHAT domain-containing protein